VAAAVKNSTRIDDHARRVHFSSNDALGFDLHSTLREDLYLVYAGQNPETQAPVIHAYLNPLVKWIWLGGVVVVLGTIVTLLPNRRAVLVLGGATRPASSAQPAGRPLVPSVALKEGHD